MSFYNYLNGITINEYNSLNEAMQEIADIPPSWKLEFVKDERDKGEHSKVLIKSSSNISNKAKFESVLSDTFNDRSNGFIIYTDKIPLIAGVKDKTNTAAFKIFVITSKQADLITDANWKKYSESDAIYKAIVDKYNEKLLGTNKIVKACNDVLSGFTSDFVIGDNNVIDIPDVLNKIPLTIKSVEIETNVKNQIDNVDDEHTSDSKAVDIVSKDLFKDKINNIVKLLPITNIAKNLDLVIDGKFKATNINDATDALKKLNVLYTNFGTLYKDAKDANDKLATPDKNWETKFANKFVNDNS